jgi:hypothetical protein
MKPFKPSNQGAAADRRRTLPSNGLRNLPATLAIDRVPAAVAEPGRHATFAT